MKDFKTLMKLLAKTCCYYIAGRKMKKAGLIKYVNVEHFLAVGPRIILDNYQGMEFSGVEKRVIAIHKLFPSAKRIGTSSWVPYGETVMFEIKYRVWSTVDICIWYQTTLDKIPPGMLHKGCEFVKEERATYSLVCSKEAM